MGGGTTELFSNRNRGNVKGIETPSLFSYDSNNVYSSTEKKTSFLQAEYVSDNKPESYLGNIEYDESVINTITLFKIIFYFLKEEFGNAKNKKVSNFLDKLEDFIINKEDGLVNSSEFKKFQKYSCIMPIQKDHGYEIVRRFLTKYFSDSSGVFMRLTKKEWVDYVHRFLKTQ